MFQITDHKEQALATSIPYLLKFPEVYKLLEQVGDRTQVIEDIAWELLYNLDYNYAKNTWLDYIGKKVGQSRTYMSKIEDAFTFGGTTAQGFDAGVFKAIKSSQSSRKSRSDYSFRNAIRAKIIENNTDASIDELIKAIKLLYNAKIVTLRESYPAGISRIDMYGSSMLQDLNAKAVIKSFLTAGVSIDYVVYHIFYNLFRNNAFITYNDIIPATNDFELSLIVKPSEISDTENTAILSQGDNWEDQFAPIRLYYDVENDEGFVFRTAPNVYNDNDGGATIYNDGENEPYYDSTSAVYLSGGTIRINEDNLIKITRVGETWSLYVNNILVDTLTSDYTLGNTEETRLFLGASNSKYYNSGSIYSLFLEDKTENKIIINDPLQVNTIGINNGVIWI